MAAHSDARAAAAASSAEGGVAAVDSEAGLDEWIRSNMADATLRRHRASLLQVTKKNYLFIHSAMTLVIERQEHALPSNLAG